MIFFRHSPRNENFNLLVQNQILLYIHIVPNNIYWSEQSFTGLGAED